MTDVALIFIINALSSFLKKWVYPKFGKVGVQVLIFGLAVLGAIYWTYGQNVLGIKEVVVAAIGLFSLSVTFYEVILSHLAVFKQPKLQGRTD